MGIPSRRDFLRIGLFGTLAARAAAAAGSASSPGAGSDLIVRNTRPLDLETPGSALASDFTPNDLFFVRSHFGAPLLVDPSPAGRPIAGWSFRIEGMVDNPGELSLSELRRLAPASAPVVLQCAGNGRALFRPRVPGAQWERGAVGQALWRGVRLADVLAKAGVRDGARYVTFLPGDHPLAATVPAFLRSIPLEKARKDVLLAWEMNHAPLPPLHGAPLRAVVPGWAGDHWVKWLRGIRIEENEDQGFYMQTGYRMPKEPIAPGAAPKQTVSIAGLPVKSLIARPLEGAVLRAGALEVEGVAFGGQGKVARLEVSTDGGASWQEAKLDDSRAEGSWQRFRYQWKAGPGLYSLRARATDSAGNSQPAQPSWNPGGYLYNAWDTVRCEVRS